MRGTINQDQIATTSKQGNGTLLQLFSGTAPVSGHVPVFDGNGNLIDSGAAPGTGTGGGTGFTVSVDGVSTGLTGSGGGGGGGATYPFVNLTAPTSSGWTWANQGSSTVSSANVLSMKSTATGSDQLRFYGQTLSTAPWTVIAALIPGAGISHGQYGGYSDGLCISDGTKFRTFWFTYPTSPGSNCEVAIQGYNSATAYNGGANLVAFALPSWPLIWLKIHCDGTTLTYFMSMDPTNTGWLFLTSEAMSSFISPSQAGLVMDLYAGGLGTNTIQSCVLLSWQISNT